MALLSLLSEEPFCTLPSVTEQKRDWAACLLGGFPASRACHTQATVGTPWYRRCDMCDFIVDFIFASTRGCLTLAGKLGFGVEQRFNAVDNLMLESHCFGELPPWRLLPSP